MPDQPITDPQAAVDAALGKTEPVTPPVVPPVVPVTPPPLGTPTIPTPPLLPSTPAPVPPTNNPPIKMNDETPLAFVAKPKPAVEVEAKISEAPPAAPLPPVTPAPPNETKPAKSGKKKVLMSIIGIFLLLAGLGGGYYFYNNYFSPEAVKIANIQTQYPTRADCEGACDNGRLLRWDSKNDRCEDSGKPCTGEGTNEQLHSTVVPCGTTNSVQCSGCGGFCILPVDKTCNQMAIEKCGESPVFGASCSTTKSSQFFKECNCGGTKYYFDSDGICNSQDAQGTVDPSYYDDYGLCAVADNGCSGTPNEPGEVTSCDFTCNSNGCSCTTNRNDCQIYHWKCDRIDNLGVGCQDGTPKVGQSATFNASCGSEQIDVMCHGDSVAFRTKVQTTACGKNPGASTTAAYSMSCTSLTKNVASPIVGSKITFTCAGATVPAAGASLLKYDFRYNIDSGSWTTLANKTSTTAELTVAACGTYSVQCRACVTYQGTTQCDPIWQGATP